MKAHIHQRKRKSNVPNGWTPEKDKNNRTVWRCPHIHQNYFSNEWRRCSFVCRKNQTTLKHDHIYRLSSQNDPGFDPSQIPRDKITFQSEFNERILHYVAKFIGATSIPSAIASSNEMKQFIISLFEESKKIRDDSILSYNISHAISLNPKNVRKSLLIEGDKTFYNIVQKLKHFKYVNLSIDAATVLNMKVVHSTTTNPYSDLSPLPFRVTQKDENDWNINDYKAEILTALAQIYSLGLIPSSICHDRLPAQSSAIRKLLLENIEMKILNILLTFHVSIISSIMLL